EAGLLQRLPGGIAKSLLVVDEKDMWRRRGHGCPNLTDHAGANSAAPAPRTVEIVCRKPELQTRGGRHASRLLGRPRWQGPTALPRRSNPNGAGSSPFIATPTLDRRRPILTFGAWQASAVGFVTPTYPSTQIAGG